MNKKIIKLKKKYGTIILEKNDYDYIIYNGWYINLHCKKNRSNYLEVNIEKGHHKYNNFKSIRLARYLLKAPNGLLVDHIDGNPLNNLRSNLRFVNNSQNQMNSKIRNNKISSFKGVTKRKNKWIARIMIDGKYKCIGYFNSEIDAAGAYNLMAKKIYKQYAKLNKFNNKIIDDQYPNKLIKTSKFIGVSRSNNNNKWLAEIAINNKRYYLGYFDSEKKAALAYNNKIIENNLNRKLNNIK